MKKTGLLLIFMLALFYACDKDDFCVEDTTPSLIVRFYDQENPLEFKAVTNLEVTAEGLTAYATETTDSLVIPLDYNQDQTVYTFKSGENEEEIQFSYNRNHIFVSRSCGYKTNFEELSAVQNTNNWITDLQIINSTIAHEEAAHIHIFH